MRKVISLALAILLVIHLGIPTVFGATSYSYTDTTVTPITEEDISLVFGGSATAGTEITKAKYVYYFTEVDATVDLADVVLNLTVYIGSTTYTARLTGRVNGYSLSSGATLWEGPISGSMTVRGTVYTVTAGFARLSSNTNAQVSVVMQPASTLNNGTLAAFIFGYTVITSSIGEEIGIASTDANAITQNSSASNDIMPGVGTLVAEPNVPYVDLNPAGTGSSNVGTYMFLGGQATYVDYSVSSPKYAHTARIYYDTDSTDLVIGIQTYCDNIKNSLLNNSALVSASVKQFSINVQMNSTSSAHAMEIIGVRKLDVVVGPDIDGTIYGILKPLFEDALAYVGENLSEMVSSSLFGGVTTVNSEAQDDYSIIMKFAEGYGVDLDGVDTIGLPIKIKIRPEHSASFVGECEFTISTQVIYQTSIFIGGNSFPLYTTTRGTSSTVRTPAL